MACAISVHIHKAYSSRPAVAADYTACMDDCNLGHTGLFAQCRLQIFRVLFGQRMGNNEELLIHSAGIHKSMLQHLLDGFLLLAANLAYRHNGSVN
ncbi:hypothetical protein D3C81_1902110 [compost metagenome]